MKRNKFAICCFLFFLTGCVTTKAPYKAGYDFSRIKNVYVEDFKSVKTDENSGHVVRSEFIKELMLRGYTVTDDKASADAFISGSVLIYQPHKKYLVILPKPGEKRIVVQQPVEIGGSNVYTFGSAFGLKDDTQIMVTNAEVGVTAMMKDAKTNEIVWTNTFNYEGLDLATSLSGVVRYLTRTIPK